MIFNAQATSNCLRGSMEINDTFLNVSFSILPFWPLPGQQPRCRCMVSLPTCSIISAAIRTHWASDKTPDKVTAFSGIHSYWTSVIRLITNTFDIVSFGNRFYWNRIIALRCDNAVIKPSESMAVPLSINQADEYSSCTVTLGPRDPVCHLFWS